MRCLPVFKAGTPSSHFQSLKKLFVSCLKMYILLRSFERISSNSTLVNVLYSDPDMQFVLEVFFV